MTPMIRLGSLVLAAALVVGAPSFAQERTPGAPRGGNPPGPPRPPVVPQQGSCKAVKVCRDARPLGDYGPPRIVCQMNTMCDGLKGRPPR